MKTRIISGAVAIALLIVVLILSDTIVFNIAFGLIAALMVYEMARAKKLDKEYGYLGVSAVFAFICPVIVYFLPNIAPLLSDHTSRFTRHSAYLALAAAPYIAVAFAYIVIVTAILLARHKSIKIGDFYTCTAYVLLICGCMHSICFIVKETLFIFLIFAFMGAWVADTGAYFAGTFFGKHRLCPEISPKKTIEGLAGGAIANAIVFAAATSFWNPSIKDAKFSPIAMAIVGVICCFLGLLGDLTASLIKRECGIKDYGNIMPGHGGAMDRFDSLIYIAPFMLIMVTAGEELLKL